MLPLLAALLIAPAQAGHATNPHHTRPSEVVVEVEVEVHREQEARRHQRPSRRSAYTYQPPPPPPIVTEGELRSLIRAVDDATWSDEQVDLVFALSRTRFFTCDQVLRLIEPISFSDSRLEAVRALQSSIVDPGNAYLLEQAFPFSDDRRQLRSMFV